jgi:hypothetical protein
MVGSAISFLLVLSATLGPQAQAAATADADLWTAAVEQLRRGLFGQDRGELVIVNQTIPTAELHNLSDSPRETRLLDLLRQRNEATRKPISGVRLPPRTRFVAPSAVPNWENFSGTFRAGEKVLRFSLPAFSEDGSRAIVYYWATGGFDDSQGGYLVFESKQEQWIVVDALGIWIT